MTIDPRVIILSNVRLSFPHIAEAQVKKGDNSPEERKSFNAEFILTPNDPAWARFHQVVQEMAVEKWKNLAPQVLQMVYGDRRLRCFGEGREKVNKKTFVMYDGYEGMVYISAARQEKDGMPQIIDAMGNGIPKENSGACKDAARKMYGGCRVNAAIKPWMQDNKYGKGIRCDFISIQFLADDKPFGEAVVDASAAFGAVPQAAGGMTPGAPWAPPGLPQAPQLQAAPAWQPPAVPGMPGVPPWQQR